MAKSVFISVLSAYSKGKSQQFEIYRDGSRDLGDLKAKQSKKKMKQENLLDAC